MAKAKIAHCWNCSTANHRSAAGRRYGRTHIPAEGSKVVRLPRATRADVDSRESFLVMEERKEEKAWSVASVPWLKTLEKGSRLDLGKDDAQRSFFSSPSGICRRRHSARIKLDHSISWLTVRVLQPGCRLLCAASPLDILVGGWIASSAAIATKVWWLRYIMAVL